MGPPGYLKIEFTPAIETIWSAFYHHHVCAAVRCHWFSWPKNTSKAKGANDNSSTSYILMCYNQGYYLVSFFKKHNLILEHWKYFHIEPIYTYIVIDWTIKNLQCLRHKAQYCTLGIGTFEYETKAASWRRRNLLNDTSASKSGSPEFLPQSFSKTALNITRGVAASFRTNNAPHMAALSFTLNPPHTAYLSGGRMGVCLHVFVYVCVCITYAHIT